MSLPRILATGLASGHGPEFVVDRPAGLGCYLLMCFSTPFRCKTVHGVREGRAGDCVLHDPTFPQWHGPEPATGRGFCNDWIHFAGRSIRGWAAKYALPFNEILPTGNAHALTDRIRSIEIEAFQKNPLWMESAALELESAMLRVSRLVSLSKFENTLGYREREHLRRFRALRSSLYQRSHEQWTASALAEMAGLGVNRFNVLYKKFFGVSAIDDLISIRIEKSKRLLIKGDCGVGEAAEHCGFSSMYYFSRLFKKKVGCCPRTFLQQTAGSRHTGELSRT